jgi:hypothetical protein
MRSLSKSFTPFCALKPGPVRIQGLYLCGTVAHFQQGSRGFPTLRIDAAEAERVPITGMRHDRLASKCRISRLRDAFGSMGKGCADKS